MGLHKTRFDLSATIRASTPTAISIVRTWSQRFRMEVTNWGLAKQFIACPNQTNLARQSRLDFWSVGWCIAGGSWRSTKIDAEAPSSAEDKATTSFLLCDSRRLGGLFSFRSWRTKLRDRRKASSANLVSCFPHHSRISHWNTQTANSVITGTVSIGDKMTPHSFDPARTFN